MDTRPDSFARSARLYVTNRSTSVTRRDREYALRGASASQCGRRACAVEHMDKLRACQPMLPVFVANQLYFLISQEWPKHWVSDHTGPKIISTDRQPDNGQRTADKADQTTPRARQSKKSPWTGQPDTDNGQRTKRTRPSRARRSMKLPWIGQPDTDDGQWTKGTPARQSRTVQEVRLTRQPDDGQRTIDKADLSRQERQGPVQELRVTVDRHHLSAAIVSLSG